MHTMFFFKIFGWIGFLVAKSDEKTPKKLETCFFFLIFPSRPWCGNAGGNVKPGHPGDQQRIAEEQTYVEEVKLLVFLLEKNIFQGQFMK